MKYKKLVNIVLCTIMLLLISSTASAHGGRTDSSGGHRDNSNRSGLGSYHYHCGGNPAHLHDGGRCPYGSGGGSSSSGSNSTPRRDTISFSNRPSSMDVGDSIALAWTISSVSGNSSVTWSSSDASVVSVNNGTLRAVGDGTATITATLSNGESSFRVTVKSVLAKSILLRNIPEKLEIGDSQTVSTAIEPSNTTDKTVLWTTSDETIATVDPQGRVLAVAPGTVTITAASVGGPKSDFKLEVFEIYPESISIVHSFIDLPLYTSEIIEATVLPIDTTKPALEWTSSDENIVSVSDGVIIGNSSGHAVITIKCQNIENILTVNVYEIEPESITVSHSSLKIQPHEKPTIEALLAPQDVTYPDLIWTSSNQGVVEVDENGRIIPVSAGNAIVSVKCKDVFIEIPVEVYILATGISFEEETMLFIDSIRKGHEIPLSVAFKPYNAGIAEYTISSSDDSVAYISDNTLYALSAGTVTLTVKSGELTQSVDIIIKQSTTYIGVWTISVLFIVACGLASTIFILLKKRIHPRNK